MRVHLSEWSIVVTGSWNTRIFSPGWVQRNVFGTNEVKVEIPTDSRYAAQVQPSPTSLSFHQTIAWCFSRLEQKIIC